jgi:hypothetical protein
MPDTQMTRRDKIIEAIFDTLPAATYWEIRTKVRANGLNVDFGDINNAIAHLRRNSAEYGWTIPHVKRGPVGLASERTRLFAVLVDREGHYELDSNPDARVNLRDGAISTAQHVATMMGNEAAALRIAATNTRSVNGRERINDLADDFAYVARKAVSVVRELRQANAA